MAHCFLATILVIMASGMPLLVTAGTQSDNAANAITIDSWALKTTPQQQSQQQQQQQPQPNSQQLQQRFSSNLNPNLYAFLDKINIPSKSSLSNTREFLQHSVDSGDLGSKLSDDSGVNQNYVFYLNNDKIPDLLQANDGDAEANTRGNRQTLNGKSVFTSANEPFSYYDFPEDEFTEIPTKAGSSFQGKDPMYSFGSNDMGMAEDKRRAPMFVGRRDQANNFKNDRYSPYNHFTDLTLWKGTDLPASYMTVVPKMAKGRMSNGSILNLSGKRGPPRFVGKREPVFEAFNGGSSILEHKRGAPRFVGKREYLFQSFHDGGSLLDHKRAAPKFVGKRKIMLESVSDGGSMLEDKRGAPRFVGKRRVPFFVGKRPVSEFYRPDVASLKDSADELMNLHDKQMKNTGSGDSTYYSNKRGAPRFVGKRLAGSGYSLGRHFGEKRGVPKFVGRSAPYLLVSHE